MFELDGTCLLFAISFVIFIGLMNFIIWLPLTKLKDDRDSEVSNIIETARNTAAMAERALQDLKQKRDSLRKDIDNAQEIVKRKAKLELQEAESSMKLELTRLKSLELSNLYSAREVALQNIEQAAEALTIQIINVIVPQNHREKVV